MRNAVIAEMKKYRHSKMLGITMLIGILLPCLLTAKDYYFKQTGLRIVDMEGWVLSALSMIQILCYPILSGFTITFIMQKEYTDNTIQNVFMAPQKRLHFLGAKIVLWGIWYFCMIVGFLLVCSGSVWLLYGLDGVKAVIGSLVEKSLVLGVLGWISMFPLLIPSVLQRKNFYPTLFLCALITVLEMSALQMSYVFIQWIPWSAVTYIGLMGVYEVRLIVMVIGCALIGFLGSMLLLRRQEY